MAHEGKPPVLTDEATDSMDVEGRDVRRDSAVGEEDPELERRSVRRRSRRASQYADEDLTEVDRRALRRPSRRPSFLDKYCRFCMKKQPVRTLRTMCACKHLVHQECLEANLRDRCEDFCELCQHKYQIEREPVSSLHVAFWSWLTSTADKVQLALALVLAVLIPYESFLLAQHVGGALGAARAAPPQDGQPPAATHPAPEVAGYWARVLQGMRLPAWSLVLVPVVLLGHALLLAALGVNTVASYLRWRCRDSAVRLL